MVLKHFLSNVINMFRGIRIAKVAIPSIIFLSVVFLRDTAPFGHLRYGIMSGASWMIEGMTALAGRREETEAEKETDLEELARALMLERLKTEELRQKSERLERALGLKEERGLQAVSARVFFYTRELGREFLIIDGGRSNGIETGGVVLDADGSVVGVVQETGLNFAKVSIASNTGSVYEVRLSPLNVKSFAKGIGGRTFMLEHIPQDVPAQQGDFMFAAIKGTPGFSYPLGQITRIVTNEAGAFQEVGGTLLARPELIREVFVIPNQHVL